MTGAEIMTLAPAVALAALAARRPQLAPVALMVAGALTGLWRYRVTASALCLVRRQQCANEAAAAAAAGAMMGAGAGAMRAGR